MVKFLRSCIYTYFYHSNFLLTRCYLRYVIIAALQFDVMTCKLDSNTPLAMTCTRGSRASTWSYPATITPEEARLTPANIYGVANAQSYTGLGRRT